MGTKLCVTTFLLGVTLCMTQTVTITPTSTSDALPSSDAPHSSPRSAASVAANRNQSQGEPSTPARTQIVFSSLSSTPSSASASVTQNLTYQSLAARSQTDSSPTTQPRSATTTDSEVPNNTPATVHYRHSGITTVLPNYYSSSWGAIIDQSIDTVTRRAGTTDPSSIRLSTLRNAVTSAGERQGTSPTPDRSSLGQNVHSTDTVSTTTSETDLSSPSSMSPSTTTSETDMSSSSSSSSPETTQDSSSSQERELHTTSSTEAVDRDDDSSPSTQASPSLSSQTSIPTVSPDLVASAEISSSYLPSERSRRIDSSESSTSTLPVISSSNIDSFTISMSEEVRIQSYSSEGSFYPTPSPSFSTEIPPRTRIEDFFSVSVSSDDHISHTVTPSLATSLESSSVLEFVFSEDRSGTTESVVQTTSDIWSETSSVDMSWTQSSVLTSDTAMLPSSSFAQTEQPYVVSVSSLSTGVPSSSIHTPELSTSPPSQSVVSETSTRISSISTSLVTSSSAIPVTSTLSPSSTISASPTLMPVIPTRTSPSSTPVTSTPKPSRNRTISTTTTTTKPIRPAAQDVRYLFILTGDCHLILNNTEFFQRFLAGFHDLIVKQLRIGQDTYKLGEISCGTVRVYVTFLHVIMPDFDIMLQTVIRNGGPGLSVPVWIDSHFATFDLTHAKHVPLAPDEHTFNIVTQVMDDVDIIVIIVACCVCGVLIAIGIAICVKECYRRKHAQSFNLLEVPHVNLKLEDFTLTRIPRPRTIYKEPSKSSHEGDHNSVNHVDPGTTVTNGHVKGTSNGGLHPSDMHLRIKQHSDGIIVGVTASTGAQNRASFSPSTSSADQSEVFTVGTAKRSKPKIRTPTGDEGEGQASERLLGNHSQGEMDGTLNPVFVDDQEEGVCGGPTEVL